MLSRTVITRAASCLTRCQVQRIHVVARSRPQLLARPQPVLYTARPRWASNKALADEKIEEITELYATAKDEFEMAMEETESNTVYAAEDREAAHEEFAKVKKAYTDIVQGADKELAEEVQRRTGQRIRELEHGLKAMDELAQNQD